MTSTITDRLYGENSAVAIKAPVVAATNGTPLPLNGLTAVGSYSPQPGDRILVKDQANPATNGIYNAATGAWARTGDFDGPNDVVQGTLVIANLNNGQWLLFQLTSPAPIIGTTPLYFVPFFQPQTVIYPQTPAEALANVVPTNTMYEALDLRRYGQNGTPIPDTAALTQALAVVNGSGVIELPPNYAGTNPATLPAGVTIIDYRVAGTFPTGTDLLGGGRWINFGGNPEGSVAGFHTQQWVTSPSETTSAILGTNKVTGNLTASGGAMASGTFELDTYGTLSGDGNIVQAVGGQTAIRSLGHTLALVVGVEGGGGIDRTTTTTNINTIVGVQGDGATNVSSAGATITNAYGMRAIQSTAAGITNNNFAFSCVGDAMFRIGDSIRVENGSAIATKAFIFTSNTLVNMPAGVTLGLASSFGIFGASPPNQPTGYGTPTGGALISSFVAGSMTLAQVAAELAQLINDLKKFGIIGA